MFVYKLYKMLNPIPKSTFLSWCHKVRNNFWLSTMKMQC